MREITDDDFEATVSKGTTVLVDFYSTFCPPCKVLQPILERLDEDNDGITFVKINVDDQMLHASRNGVTSLPTLILFVGGYEERRHVGAMSAPALKTWLGV